MTNRTHSITAVQASNNNKQSDLETNCVNHIHAASSRPLLTWCPIIQPRHAPDDDTDYCWKIHPLYSICNFAK